MARSKRQALTIADKQLLRQADATPRQGTQPIGRRDLLLAAGLLAAVFAAYQPAWNGGFVWDDNAHVTKPELRSWQGLSEIWLTPGAAQQYYPLLHSVFWIEHKLWGDSALGYHLVNILMHGLAAILVAIVLRRLAVPGAYLAAAIFALHPVHVESVAWITELKNTLSAVLYLGAALQYLRFDRTQKKSDYFAALSLFVLALMSKTVTATLPGALLVVFWWRRGRLSWRRDVTPLLPFFALGAAAGLFTAWVERTQIGAEGAAFDLTVVERFLLAGRVVWFYLGKLVWPADLIFIYPRWHVSQAMWQQYVYPAALVLLVITLWAVRRRWRGPLASLLFFVGTLFPVLGFVNVYPFVFSYVADHFQYLASLGIIALVAAGATLLANRAAALGRSTGYSICIAVVGTLGVLTWRQCGMYADAETLYRATIARNPQCAMAENNLGNVLADAGRKEEALLHYQAAVDIQADCDAAHFNLANVLAARGETDAAIGHFRRVVALRPDKAEAHNNLGRVLAACGQPDEAMAHYRRALEIRPNYPEAHYNLANALVARGQVQKAVDHFQQTLAVQPKCVEAHYGLGNALAMLGRLEEAVSHYREAAQLRPDYVPALNDLAWQLATHADASVRNGTKAVELARRAERLTGGEQADVLDTLAAAYAESGQFADAVAAARKALTLAEKQHRRKLADSLRQRLALYEAKTPFRQRTSNSSPPAG
ncbi:MAG: tetratricopeptide repeat protein [Thermoguttaceae bacterium]